MTFIPGRYISNALSPDEQPKQGLLHLLDLPRKPMPRALLWTFSTPDPVDDFINHIWLQNGTGDLITRVSVGNVAFTTVDDDCCVGSPTATVYEEVLPGEAIRIDTRHIMYDSDYVIGVDLLIELPGQKPMPLSTGAAKGGSVGGILLRENSQ